MSKKTNADILQEELEAHFGGVADIPTAFWWLTSELNEVTETKKQCLKALRDIIMALPNVYLRESLLEKYKILLAELKG